MHRFVNFELRRLAFAAVVCCAATARAADPPVFSPLPKIDDRQVQAIGIRKVVGKHLTLYTDLPAGQEVDELPAVFDLAVPQWCDYFAVDRAWLARWHVVGCVMTAKDRFQQAGLLPANVPEFLHGFQIGSQVWLREQPSAYYRRHLLLHEGTHAFMHEVLGGTGPPWYAEGMAELFGTHRWHDGQLTLRYLPRTREEVPEWGRVKIVRDDYAASRGLSLDEVMKYGPRAHLETGPYGWCWAATTFLDSHPRSQTKFRELRRNVKDSSLEFSRRFFKSLQTDWRDLAEEWQIIVAEIDYGYDVARAAVERKPAVPLPAKGITVRIAANRGWQSSGIQLAADKKYRIRAAGRFQIAGEPKPWWCEPGGVTIRYYQQRPLGMVLASVTDDTQPLKEVTPLISPEPIGFDRTLTFRRAGTLYLRINESPAGLADNSGEIQVRIEETQ